MRREERCEEKRSEMWRKKRNREYRRVLGSDVLLQTVKYTKYGKYGPKAKKREANNEMKKDEKYGSVQYEKVDYYEGQNNIFVSHLVSQYSIFTFLMADKM
jgi:hypothetical protein